MSKMTDKEIIKALGFCSKSGWLNDCDGCPCYDENEDIQTSECQERIMKNALDLINRQQAEIDMLNAENTLAISERNAFQKSFYAIVKENRQLKADLKEVGAEYERLDDTVANGAEVCHECHEKYDKKIKQTKAEAIKEFADRLKEHLKGNGGLYCVTTMNAQIDNLVKEMVGADNE